MACFRPIRGACAANANTAMSMQAVLPEAVGKAMASGHGASEPPITLSANACCHAKGRWSHDAVKNSAKSVAVKSVTGFTPDGS